MFRGIRMTYKVCFSSPTNVWLVNQTPPLLPYMDAKYATRSTTTSIIQPHKNSGCWLDFTLWTVRKFIFSVAHFWQNFNNVYKQIKFTMQVIIKSKSIARDHLHKAQAEESLWLCWFIAFFRCFIAWYLCSPPALYNTFPTSMAWYRLCAASAVKHQLTNLTIMIQSGLKVML